MRIPGEELKLQDKLDNSEYVVFNPHKGYSLKENAPQDIKDTYKKYCNYWKNKTNSA